LFDFLQSVDGALIAAWAVACGLLPRLGVLEIGCPERPSSALDWARLIDGATASLRIEKDAIAVGIFDKAFPGSHATNKTPLELFDVLAHPDRFCHCGDLFWFHPDESRGSPAASTALGAFKRKPFSIPGGRVIGRHVDPLC
jgi:hypothetical protein